MAIFVIMKEITGYLKLDPGSLMLDTGYWMLDARYSSLVCLIADIGYSLQIVIP